MATNDEFDAVMAILATAYPNYQLPDPSMALYEQELADVPGDALLEAARRHFRQSKFFPTIAELRADYDDAQKRKRLGDGREWKRRLEAAKAEALPAGEASRLLAEVNEKAGTALVPVKGGASRIVKRDFKVGAGMTDQEWAEHQRRVKEKTGA